MKFHEKFRFTNKYNFNKSTVIFNASIIFALLLSSDLKEQLQLKISHITEKSVKINLVFKLRRVR